MTGLTFWATAWLDDLARDGMPPSPGLHRRGLLLHDSLWKLVTIESLLTELRRLESHNVGDDSLSGKCGVAFEAPWQGQEAVWISAFYYQHGSLFENFVSVRHVRDGTVTKTADSIEEALHSVAQSEAVRVAPHTQSDARQALSGSDSAMRGAGLDGALESVAEAPRGHSMRPLRSTRSTFWWSFLFGPFWGVSAILSFRRAEAQGENGGVYIRAWLLGWAAGVVTGTVTWLLSLVAFISIVSQGH